MQVIIDRFEGDYAVVELPDRTMVNLHKVLVPEAKEGDVITIAIDLDATEERKKQIQSMMEDIWQ